MLQNAREMFEGWMQTRNLKPPTATSGFTEDDVVELIDQEFTAIEAMDAGDAIPRLLIVVQFINDYAQSSPVLLDKLRDLVRRLKDAVDKIAHDFGVGSCGITVSAPCGFSINLSWDV